MKANGAEVRRYANRFDALGVLSSKRHALASPNYDASEVVHYLVRLKYPNTP